MANSFAGIDVPQGDPDALETASHDFGSMAGSSFRVATQLRDAPASLSSWLGPAGMAFTAISMTASASATSSADAFVHAARQARAYADELRESRSDAKAAIADARNAQDRIEEATTALEEARAAAAAATIRYAAAAARLLLPDLTGANATAAQEDMNQAQRDIDAAEKRERRAKHALAEARDDLKRAQRRGRDAQQRAADARQKASLAFGAIGFGLPGIPSPGAPAVASVGATSARPLTPFARLAAAQVDGGRGGDVPSLGASALGPLASIFASANPAPSDDYQSWRDPARREAELQQLYGDAEPATEEFDIEDLDGLDQGRLRVGLFIMGREAGPLQALNMNLKGDGRGFDPQFSPNHSRAYLELDFERDKAYVQVNPSCDADGSDCEDARDIAQDDLFNFGDYKNEVEPNDTDGDDVHVSWELTQSKGALKPIPVVTEAVSGPSIDGDLHVTPGPGGKPQVTLEGDEFPSREVYYDDGQGRTHQAIPPREEHGGGGTLKLFPIID